MCAQAVRLGAVKRPSPKAWRRHLHRDLSRVVGRAASRCQRNCRRAAGRVWPLFDHSVREREQRWRDGQVEVLRGLEIERKIEAGWTFDGQIRRLLAVEDMPGIHPDFAK